MSDRKYRQRGYQDEGPRERRPQGAQGPQQTKRPLEPRDPRMPRDPRVPNMPGFREVFRCTRCGSIEPIAIGPESTCIKCGTDLHACVQCSSFDAGATFECMQQIPVRVSPKDARNTCTLFSARIKVERETGSTPASPGSGAKKAFDDLFKF